MFDIIYTGDVMAKKRKFKSSPLLIVVIIFIIWGGTIFLQEIKSNTYKVHVDIDTSAGVNVPTNFKFTITKKDKEYTPNNVNLQIYHIYDSNSQVNVTIPAYAEGQYELLLTPEKSGKYHWIITFDEANKTFEGDFTI